jgi:hypothetical protein
VIEESVGEFFYLPDRCPSRGGIHARLQGMCSLCGWTPPVVGAGGRVSLDELMEVGTGPYRPKHRRSVFWDRWRR